MSDLFVCCRSSRLYSRSRMGMPPHVRIERDAQVAAPAGGSENRCDRRPPRWAQGGACGYTARRIELVVARQTSRGRAKRVG